MHLLDFTCRPVGSRITSSTMTNMRWNIFWVTEVKLMFVLGSFVWIMVESTSIFQSTNRTRSNLSKEDTIAVLGNSTSAPTYEWEYYYDYVDPVFVDERQLKYHKYSIVIILWVSLAAFVGFLFLILNLMSVSIKFPKIHKSDVQPHERRSTATPQADSRDGSEGCLSP